jgi:hypothetical protein
LRNAASSLTRPVGKCIARDRRGHNCKRVGRIRAEPRRVSEERYQSLKLHDGSRPPMRQEQRHRIPPDSRRVNEMNIEIADGDDELPKFVESCLMHAPIVRTTPVRHQIPL